MNERPTKSLTSLSRLDPIEDASSAGTLGIAIGVGLIHGGKRNNQPFIVNPLNALHLASVEYDYSVLEAIYPADTTREILEFIHEEIRAEDVFTDEREGIKGKEDTPHITLLYGIKEQKPNIPKIEQVIQNHSSMGRIKWVGLGKFETETYDVLIVLIDSEEAEELFRDFNNIYPDNMNSHPKYVPHTTLAYLNKGEADKYIKEYSEVFTGDTDVQWIRFDFNGSSTDFCPISGEVRA